ncbi:MAG: NfeD family protein [Thiolinea sp.]
MEVSSFLNEPIQFWYWLILGVVFLGLEVLAPGAILMWFGAGAIVTGLLMWLLPDLAIGWQLLLFAVVSGISVLAWRNSSFFSEESTPPPDPNLNNRLQSYVGREYTLSEAITNGRGSVRVVDSNWRVQGKDMPQGTRVKVVGVDGITFLVEALD